MNNKNPKSKIKLNRGTIIFGFFLAAAIVVIQSRRPAVDKPESSKPLPRYVKDDDVIYVNTTPDVRFVGSDACRSCHGDIYDSYLKSEMGRSMAKLDSANIIESYPQKQPVYDSEKNFYYEMVKKDGRFYQREYRLDNKGKLMHERWMEAEYVIGSGNNLRMYFHDENGMLYQLPLTWYVHKKSWDLSPGYRDFGNVRFSRYASAKCISCHNSFMTPRSTANDRYEKPFPLGIGCERCHGPGELHVRQMRGDKLNIPPNARTIVNPRKLSPLRQLDVCRQCHLQGKAWALHGDSNWFDYRPAMLLESHRSVYFPQQTHKEVFEVADSPHRLSLSRCFKESTGALNCITCHNPHYSIKTFTARHYNSVCLSCHSTSNLPGSGKQSPHTAADNCIACHMNRTGTDNTLHGVSNTDHWIRVGANRTVIDWSALRRSSAGDSAINLVPDIDAPDEGRDIRRGMAYLDLYSEHDRRSAYRDSAQFYLNRGSTQIKNNAIAYFYLGKIQFELGEYVQSIMSFERAIALRPNFAEGFFWLGKAHLANQNRNLSIQNYRQALKLKPEEPAYLESLGTALVEVNPDEAVSLLEQAIQLDQQNPLTYYTLGNLYAISFRQPETALAYYQKAVTLDPDLPNGFLNLGNAYTLVGNYKEAITSYEKEFSIRPSSPLAFINLGRVYTLMGKKTEARDAFHKALQIDPTITLARQFLQQLEN
jgi:tetratricopeptide (TPR) repeat protein